MNPFNPKTTLTISTAVTLVIAILALVGITVWAPPESRTELLASGGILSAVILGAMRSLWSAPAKLLPLAFALAFLPHAMACSPSSLQVHAEVASALHETAVDSRELVRTWRTDHMREAARAAHDAGAPLEEAQHAAELAAVEAEPLIAAQRAYADAVADFVDAALLASASGGLQITDLARELGPLFQTVHDLRDLAIALGADAIAAIPWLPPELDALLTGSAGGGQ